MKDNSSSCDDARPVIVLKPLHIPQPDGTIVTYPGKPIVLEESVTTRDAARILGFTRDRVARLCDEGYFRTAFKPRDSTYAHWRITRTEILNLLAARVTRMT